MRASIRSHLATSSTAALTIATLLFFGCSGRSKTPPPEEPPARADLGVDPAQLTPTIDNPYVAFAAVKRAVYQGSEMDDTTHEKVRVRVESVVRDSPETIAGVKATAVDVSDFEDGELVETTRDYYAQDPSGAVYYIGEVVDDYEGDRVVGHGGQWIAGEGGSRAGVFMPAVPRVGDVFDQERAPGIAEDRSSVIATGLTVTVPAGTFKDCIETEDFDPISKKTQKKIYCRGVGLIREVYGQGGSIELIQLEPR